VLIECPLKLATPSTWDAFDAERQAEKGCWPVEGGWLSQTQWCLEAVDFVRSVRAQVRAEAESGG
jgi:hypothetical protein